MSSLVRPLRSFGACYKLLVVGSLASGKNAFVCALKGESAPVAHVPTLGAELHQLEVALHGEACELHVWNYGGHERFRPLIQWDDVDGIFILVDGTSLASLHEAVFYYQECQRTCSAAAVVLVINKSDGESAFSAAELADARLDHLPLVHCAARLARHTDAALQAMLTTLPKK